MKIDGGRHLAKGRCLPHFLSSGPVPHTLVVPVRVVGLGQPWSGPFFVLSLARVSAKSSAHAVDPGCLQWEKFCVCVWGVGGCFPE